MESNHDNIEVNEDDRNGEVDTHDDCMHTDKETHTAFSKAELSAKIETIVVKNELKTVRESKSRIVSNLSFDMIAQKSDHMKHFTGLTNKNFDMLYKFINGVCPLSEITYWGLEIKEIQLKQIKRY